MSIHIRTCMCIYIYACTYIYTDIYMYILCIYVDRYRCSKEIRKLRPFVCLFDFLLGGGGWGMGGGGWTGACVCV